MNAKISSWECVWMFPLIACVFAATAFSQKEPCATASRFGPNDQIGNVSYITPAKTLAATKLVTTGKAYRLGIETNKNTPAYGTRKFAITVLQPDQAGGGSLGPTKTTYNDDIINGWVGVGSQIDGLGHAGIDGLYYNCNRAADFTKPDGLTKLGIENVPAIATRGILLDMAGYFGTDVVKEGTAFNRAEIEGAMKRQGIAAIEKGDVVLFYSGWMKLLGKDDKRFISANPGLGRDGARYLASLGVAAIGSDTSNFEVIPFESGAGFYEVHQILLAMNGVHILENMNTEEMVADKAWEFLFTLGPARITGSVQAIINPIAIR
jgi:kynurenine formamidase